MVGKDFSQVISNCSLFEGLPHGQISFLDSLIQRRTYNNGEYIIRQGDNGGELFIIESGKVITQVKGPDGKPTTINELGPGDFFGEIGLLTGGHRSADVIAIGPVATNLLSKADYFRFVGQSAEIQQAAMKTAVDRIRVSTDVEAVRVQEAIDHVLGKLMRFELRALRSSGVCHDIVSFDELVKFYQSVKFLYPAKLKELAPRFSDIEDTWTKLLNANNKIFKVFIRKELSNGKVVIGSSVCAFEYSPGTWQTQHLVSASRHGFTGTLLMLLALMNWFGRNSDIDMVRFTYRPNNPGVVRLFEKFGKNLGGEMSHSTTYDYLLSTFVNELSKDTKGHTQYSIVPVSDESLQRVIQFYAKRLHPVEFRSLHLTDPQLQKTRRRFSDFGLYRYRQIFAALSNNRVVGAVICNFASEGINFSFLENEITALELDKDLPAQMQLSIFRSLISSAVRYYREHGRDYVVFMIGLKYKGFRDAIGMTSNKQYAVFASFADSDSTKTAFKASTQYYREHLVRK